ncbi:cyclin-like protein [Collybia nuda]|uniref:Cyclin-like protein n=1 Tax=Collybia nuda TaxID=64659 RepID=A0A9P6CJH7_9AGAR|nr:cyclin-like protein [Collybia nuda]
MDFPQSRNQSPSQLPTSSSKYHHPYFTSAEVEYLSEKQRGKFSATQDEKTRQTACGFLEAMGARIGFPRRTTATAQNLYHRFHLFFSRKDFQNYWARIFDVALGALYVSTKMHDTLKKPRELLAVSYAVRFPELAAKSKHPGGEVDLDTMDSQIIEADRQRLLAVERLILETICFNFTSRMPFPYVIKIGRALKVTKQLTKLAWRLAVDSHRTLLPIQYPPHTIALGSIYVACLLSSFEQLELPNQEGFQTSQKIVSLLGKRGNWEKKYHSQVEDLEDIAHTIIDILIQGAQSPSASTSPSTPSSPTPHPSRNMHIPPVASQLPTPFNADQLIRLKITMRETEHPPRVRHPLGSVDPSALYGKDGTLQVGRNNDGTVRFLFGPPGIAGP